MGITIQNDVAGYAERTLVVGLGASGYSALHFLCARGEDPVVVDSREAPPLLDRVRREFPDLEMELGAFSPEFFSRFRRIVASPGVSIDHPAIRMARDFGVEVIGDVELFARSVQAPVIGITGSNGKSTVTSLVGEMLDASGYRVRVGGNIGTPALDLLEGGEADFYVLELSSFQLETTSSLKTVAASVLNLSPDHLDRYPDPADYGRAKARIYSGCSACVVNRDDASAAALVGAGIVPRISFGLSEPRDGDQFGVIREGGRGWLAKGSERLLAVDELRLQGAHNVSNVLAALALVTAAGAMLDAAMLACVCSFRGLPHRMELVADSGGVRWINDSKGTNVGATDAAIRGLEAPVVLIAGGQGKGADFSPLADAARGRVRHAILFGVEREALSAALADVVTTHCVETLEQAVDDALGLAQEGDVVLFSPACASFDMFRNFEHRGDVFRSLASRVATCRQ